MKPNKEHREVVSGRASAEASRRFKGTLRNEVGDIEVRLEEAQLRSAAFEEAGLHSEAAKVLAESRVMVDDFQKRLSAALAQAAVERETEQIFASSQDVMAVLGEHETTSGGVFARLPAGIGAAVASVAVLAVALVTMRAPGDRALRPASDISALTGDGQDASPSASPTATEQLILSLSPVEQAILGDTDVRVDADIVAPLFAQRRALLDRLAVPASASMAVQAQLDALVEQLRSEGVDIERLMWLERVEAEQVEADEAQTPEANEPAEPAQPTEPSEPSEPATEEPSEDASDDDEGVFPPFGDGGEGDDEGGAGAEGDGSDSGSKGDGTDADGDDGGTGILDR